MNLSQELQNNSVAQESLYVPVNVRLGYKTRFMKRTKTHRPEYIYVGFKNLESAKALQEKLGGVIRSAQRLTECKYELIIKTKDYELINKLEAKLQVPQIQKQPSQSTTNQQKEAPMSLQIIEQTVTQFIVTAVDLVTVTEDKPKPYNKYRWTFKTRGEAEDFIAVFAEMNQC